MLPLYFLLRGRTPEALHAYARHCPRTPATQQQLELQALLTEAARMLPAPQVRLLLQPAQTAAVCFAANQHAHQTAAAGEQAQRQAWLLQAWLLRGPRAA